MRSKFQRITFFIAVIMLTTVFLPVLAADKPSDWAESEVYAAIEHNLVPQLLQSNYKNNITRTEYVLLALQVYEKAGYYLQDKDDSPFSDTEKHPYEKEINRAYHAGIIKGDGKGHFFPDNYITREEISSLVVNLLKQISPNKDYTVKNKHVFADNSSISDWASDYINYCYENKILNGYSGNIMDPKGNATIEQSIALLYRLANSEKLLESTYGTIQFIDIYTGSSIEVPPKVINEFVENYSVDTFNAIKQLSNNENIDILSILENHANISINNSSILIDDEDDLVTVKLLVHNVNDELVISAYKQLLATFMVSEQGITVLDNYIAQMKANEWIDSFADLSENTSFLVQTLDDVSGVNSYLVTYRQE